MGQLKYSETVTNLQSKTNWNDAGGSQQIQKNAYPDSSSLLYILKFTPQFDLCSSDVFFTFATNHSRVYEPNKTKEIFLYGNCSRRKKSLK